MKLIKTTMYSTLLTVLLSTNVMADCSYELFSISSTKNTKIIDFIEQLSDECEFTIIITDPNTQKFLDTNLNKTNLNNLTINEVLDLVLKENNLTYSLENNILRVAYLETKMFNIDYILSQRKSTGTTDVTLSSEGAGLSDPTQLATMSRSGGEEQSIGGGGAGKSGIKIDSSDEVMFWHELDLELQQVLNRPQDVYLAQPPIINKNAGIVTVTATVKQMERLKSYLEKLQAKVQLQVLIDVQLLSVNLSSGKTTGVDWSQLYRLQNSTLDFSTGKGEERDGTNRDEAYVTLAGGGSLDEVIKFLKTQGDVSSISNPKVLTLNNQPAIISAGTEYFYKISTTGIAGGTNLDTATTEENVQSIFAGVLLDITPEISDDNMITLKINPSLSETASEIAVNNEDRTMPPDLSRRQLSSVVTVKDGNRIILGGLISTSNHININKVPILGDIPILNYLFKYEETQKTTHELVIVIEPHIISKESEDLSLSDLGYQGFSEKVLLNAKDAITVTENAIKEED